MHDAAWTDLHDLALVYVALLCGTRKDDRRAGGESASEAASEPASDAPSAGRRPAQPLEEACRHLARLYPETSDARLHRVVQKAFLMYVGATGRSMLDVAVVSLRRALPRPRRLAVLDDLAGLAVGGERALRSSGLPFIQYLAVRWGLGPERSE